MPRIDRGCDLRVVSYKRPFRQLELSEQHRPGTSEPLNDGRVKVRQEVGQHWTAGSGRNSPGIAKVLYGEGNSMKRSTVFAVGQFFLCLRGLLQRELGSDGRIRVESGLELRD